MATLHENTLHFNQKISISHTGGNLSSDGGLVLVREFLDALGFSRLLRENVHILDERKYCTHENHALLEQLLLQMIAGYPTDSSANLLARDPVFQLVLGKERLASQPTLSRFWQRLSPANIGQLQELNQALIDQVRLARNDTALVLDLDSTHSDTYGNQEEAAYNGHYGTTGYHPLVAFDGLTGDFLKAELRPGNVYTSTGVQEFLEPLLEHYRDTLPCTDILVRGDSGFARPEVYAAFEARGSRYVIRLKANPNLMRLAEEFVRFGDAHPWQEREIHYHSVSYQAASWGRKRRVCLRSTREAGELVFRHEYVVTNLAESVPAEWVFQTYQQRGTMENYIKEAKHGFFLDKTDSSGFRENQTTVKNPAIKPP